MQIRFIEAMTPSTGWLNIPRYEYTLNQYRHILWWILFCFFFLKIWEMNAFPTVSPSFIWMKYYWWRAIVLAKYYYTFSTRQYSYQWNWSSVIRPVDNSASIILLNGHHHRNGNGYVISPYKSPKIPVSFLFFISSSEINKNGCVQQRKKENEHKEVKCHHFQQLVIVCDMLHQWWHFAMHVASIAGGQIWISALFRITLMTSFSSCVVCGKIISYLLHTPFMLNSIVALNRKPNHTWWASRHFHVYDCIFIAILCQIQRIIDTNR